jgi:hypothetical protein
MSGASLGDASEPVSVVYDTPARLGAERHGNPDGSVSISWLPATDPSPGAGLSVRRPARRADVASRPDPTAGTGVCTVTTSRQGVSTASEQRLDLRLLGLRDRRAGNRTHQSVSVRASIPWRPIPVTASRLRRPDHRPPRVGCARPQATTPISPDIA